MVVTCSVVGAVTTGVVVPAVTLVVVTGDETAPARSGFGDAVPSMVAGAGVLVDGLEVPVGRSRLAWSASPCRRA